MLLTEDGQRRVAEIARNRGFSTEAAEVMLFSLIRGNGNQAQFNHPEFGGMGQWSMGGMLMIGDMFNNGLKARVDGLANELSNLMANTSLLQPQRAEAGGFFNATSIWPAELGAPSSSGAQNDMQYAVFPAQRRLAVMRGGQVYIYDTGDHLIGGVSQQQGGGNSLLFTSQYGPVPLESLTPVTQTGTAEAQPIIPEPTPPQSPEPLHTIPDTAPPQMFSPPLDAPLTPSLSAQPAKDENSIFATIEQLHGLFARGILTQSEFDEKKAELLSRL